jgi:hypothetical protein
VDRRRLEQIEKYVLAFFQGQGRSHILAKELFASTVEFANADLVRALEDLERRSVCSCGTLRRVTITFR